MIKSLRGFSGHCVTSQTLFLSTKTSTFFPFNESYKLSTSGKKAIIGKGNMAKTVIGGLLKDGINIEQIILSSPSINHLGYYEMEINGTTYQIKVAQSNEQAVQISDSVILVVKPFHAKTALESFAGVLKDKPLVSAMAGITIQTIKALLNAPDANIIRLMPNTPATIGQGTGASYQLAQMSLLSTQQESVELICKAFGCPISLNQESLLNAVTATSGSGAAYVFLFIECLLKIYVSQGLDEPSAMTLIENHFRTEEQLTAMNDALLLRQFKNDMKQCARDMDLKPVDAEQLVDQTFDGAMALVQQAIQHQPEKSPINIAAELRTNVTSKGGTTFAALETFRKGSLLEILKALMNPKLTQNELTQFQDSLSKLTRQAMCAASDRAEEMAHEAEINARPIITP